MHKLLQQGLHIVNFSVTIVVVVMTLRTRCPAHPPLSACFFFSFLYPGSPRLFHMVAGWLILHPLRWGRKMWFQGLTWKRKAAPLYHKLYLSLIGSAGPHCWTKLQAGRGSQTLQWPLHHSGFFFFLPDLFFYLLPLIRSGELCFPAPEAKNLLSLTLISCSN